MTRAATTQTIADALDAALLDALTNGQEVIGPDGAPMLDAKGQPVRKKPSAAVLNVARGRVKDRCRQDPQAESTTAEVLRKLQQEGRPDAATRNPDESYGELEGED